MFERVIGQALPKEILKNAVQSGKLSHAYLFHGPEGVGKTTLATEFAKAIICRNHTGCGECDYCQQFFSTSDIRILRGEKSISVDHIRQITSEIYLKPFQFEKKIYIIADAHKMTVQAQNALLKVFEEPPSYAVMILVTSNLSMILPTILSRGVSVRFAPLSPGEIAECFQKEGKEVPSQDILERANGSFTKAFHLAASEEYLSMRKAVTDSIVSLFRERTTRAVIRLYGDFLNYEEFFDSLLDIFNSFVYDSTVKEPTLLKNKDLGAVLSLSVKTADAIYRELGLLKEKLSANGAYNIAVMSALTAIRNHLNEERIS